MPKASALGRFLLSEEIKSYFQNFLHGNNSNYYFFADTPRRNRRISPGVSDDEFKSGGNLERVGDYAENIMEYATTLKNEEGHFSETAVAEIAYMREQIESLFEQIIKAYTNKDSESLLKAYEIEENVDHITKRMGENHIIRLNSGICTALVGTQYMSLASNSERIADHLVNVGKMINEW